MNDLGFWQLNFKNKLIMAIWSLILKVVVIEQITDDIKTKATAIFFVNIKFKLW